MATRKDRKPDGCSLEGMIWRANDILAKAVSSETNGIPKNVFEECHGIFIISSLQVGFMFTNSVGAGIAMVKDPVSGKWSLPCACSLSGLGVGFIIGGGHSDFIVFCMDETTLNQFCLGDACSPKQVKGADFGSFDRTSTVHFDNTHGGDVAISFSKGAFVGVGIQESNIMPRAYANRKFYGKELKTKDILYGTKVEMPKDKVTMMDEIYAKLEILSKGETAETDDADKVENSKASAIAQEVEASKDKEADIQTIHDLTALVDAEKEKQGAVMAEIRD